MEVATSLTLEEANKSTKRLKSRDGPGRRECMYF